MQGYEGSRIMRLRSRDPRRDPQNFVTCEGFTSVDDISQVRKQAVLHIDEMAHTFTLKNYLEIPCANSTNERFYV
jgi:hypothetical protein